MDIAVLIKQVPVSNNVSVDPETHALIRASAEGMINPADLNAIEEAMVLKEQTGGKVVVFTMGPPDAEKALREAMAHGCDESCLITDRVVAGGDTIATARVLAEAIKKYGHFDLILGGALSADGATGQVGAMVAECLGIPHICEIQSIQYDEAAPDKIEAVKKVYGERFRVRVSLPAVISVNFGCNVPRLATLRSTRAAKSKPLTTYTNADLELPEDQVGIKGSPTTVIDSFEPTGGRIAEMIEGTPEEISALVVAESCDGIIEELKGIGVEKIYAIKTDHDLLLQDDAASQMIADMLKKIDPSSVLIPATPTGRSLFSRVAMKLNCGLTADCTELLVGAKEDGTYYIKQNKPSYGENVFVTIITREGYYPQMMTVRPGVYMVPEQTEGQAEVIYMDDIQAPVSQEEVVEILPQEESTDSILSSEIVVVGGRGALEDDNFTLVKEFADKIGAAIGGTRPMVDTGTIPFDHQIGQTGLTIRPKICISLGVSGAIQHTEGIKDTKLFVAVNTDENAAIFKVADYGIQADLREVLENYMKL